MYTIEVAEDVYEYLLRNTGRIGEDASSILRRLLGLPSPNGGSKGHTGPISQEANASDQALSEFVKSSRLLARRTATEKFLRILGFAYEAAGDEFERVLQLSGRRRTYFARSRDEIARSGKSTHPRQIPGSDYWVVTNADTDQKKDILIRVLKLLKYSPEVARQAARALG